MKNDLNTNLTQLKTEKIVLSTEKNNLNKENQVFQAKIRLLEESLRNQVNSIKDLQFDKDQTFFYDIVVDIESLRDLMTSGWKINCSESLFDYIIKETLNLMQEFKGQIIAELKKKFYENTNIDIERINQIYKNLVQVSLEKEEDLRI